MGMANLHKVHMSHLAMATEFEITLYGENELHLSTVAEEVMREIDRLEAQLSFYRADSDVRQINAYAATQPVPLDPRVYRLLERAQELNRVTQGTFDITIAPLMRCWGFVGASGQMPTPEAVEAALAVVGMDHVLLDPDEYTIAFDREGVEIELGAIGKGYAIERCLDILQEYEIESALLHGGTSAVYALGAPPDADAWKVALQKPLTSQAVPEEQTKSEARQEQNGYTGGDQSGVEAKNFKQDCEGEYLAVLEMRDVSLSVSAPHGKWFASQGRRYGHVIDPRTGYPTGRGLLAAILMPSATDGDALSTSLLTLGESFLPTLQAYCPQSRALVVSEDENGAAQVTTAGITPGK